jgi:nitrogen fixation/metabolism regulation signal transduction histidine kinase
MVFGRYNIQIVLLALLLAAISLCIGWVYFDLHAWITLVNLSLLWIVVLALLLYKVRRVNRDLARFFQAIRDRESSMGFTISNTDPVFTELYEQMNSVFIEQGRIKREKEQEYIFFSAVFNHADVGLIVYDKKGEISLINRAARNLLGVAELKSIHSLQLPDTSNPDFPAGMRAGERALVKIRRNSETIHLSVRSRQINIPEKELTLLSLQNIKQELELNEVESWQKLIRVFIHEIMNSVSPITLTAAAIIQMLETNNSNKEATSPQQLESIISGLDAIRKRSRGMAAFMDSYRQLTRIPTPDFDWIRIGQLFGVIERLMKDEFMKNGIGFDIKIAPPDIRLWGDEKLVEQILINLLRNAMEALVKTDNAQIILTCVSQYENTIITVHDNGPGIDTESGENIFVPFYTTKHEGTGLGLSISRQIMNLHKGNIAVQSLPGNTVFQLNFPKLK